jgi:chromosome segregation ATPase
MKMLRSAAIALALTAAAAPAQSSLSACSQTLDSARQVVKVSTGLRVCLLAVQPSSAEGLPRDWAATARTLILETQRDGDNLRAALSGTRLSWTINGREAPADSLADAWQKAVVDYADAAFQADDLRRRVTELRAEIDSLPERIRATRERIKYLERRESELTLEIQRAGNPRPNELRGESSASEASLRSSIQQLEAQRSAAERRAATAEAQAVAERDDRKRASYAAQAQAEREKADRAAHSLRLMEQRLTGGSAHAVARAQEDLRTLRPRENIALLKMQLANYESVDAQDIERAIRELDAPRRLPALDAQAERARLALVSVLEARRKTGSL